MQRNKIIAVLALVVLGGCLLFAKSRDAPVPPHEDDDDAPAATTAPAAKTAPAPPVASGPVQPDVTKLQITDERVGTGPVAQSGDDLSMNYKGTLTNGEVFDQSYGKAPFDFKLGAGRVIPGWDQGIVGMKVGGKRKLVIPPDMGYGASGQGPIPPNATLIFEVELLSVNGKS